MSEKKSFVMYESWGSVFERMSNEQAGELIKTIYAYQKDPEAVPNDPAISFVFELIKQQLDEDKEKYKKVCAARADAGKSGGRPKANDSEEKQTLSDEKQKKQMLLEKSKKSKCFFEKAKKADNDNDNDNDLKETTLESGKEKCFAPPTHENVSMYCKEMGFEHVDIERFIDYYSSVGWETPSGNKITDWRAKVREWERQDKRKRQEGAVKATKKTGFHNLEEHGYDYQAIVDRLFMPAIGENVS